MPTVGAHDILRYFSRLNIVNRFQEVPSATIFVTPQTLTVNAFCIPNFGPWNDKNFHVGGAADE